MIHALIEWLNYTFLYRPHRKISIGTHSLKNNALRHWNLKRSNYLKSWWFNVVFWIIYFSVPILSDCHFYITTGRATKTFLIKSKCIRGKSNASETVRSGRIDHRGMNVSLTQRSDWRLSEGSCESAKHSIHHPWAVAFDQRQESGLKRLMQIHSFPDVQSYTESRKKHWITVPSADGLKNVSKHDS